MAEINAVSGSEFDQAVLQATGPVVVDFWAPWCGPCRMLAPALERVAERFAGRVTFLKCDVDQNPEQSNEYGVQTIPNLMFFKSGQVVDQLVGFIKESEIVAHVETALGQPK